MLPAVDSPAWLGDNRSNMAVSPQHFTEVEGARVQFRLRGTGEPLVMLHGWGQSSLSFMAAGSALEQRFRLLTPDLPGFGFSEPPPAAWGSTEYARVVASLVKSAGFGTTNVLGHSFGGKVALALATAYPELVRRLVIVASPIVRLPLEGVERRGSNGYRWVRRVAGIAPLPLRERVLEWGRNRYGSADYRAAGALRPTLVRVVNEDWRPALAAVQAPVLLLWGSADQDVPLRVAEEAKEALPRAELRVMEGAGHFPFLDQPEAFVEAVSGFLAADD
jgi:pimeloyl-ACP methyl ester carboxylesterase